MTPEPIDNALPVLPYATPLGLEAGVWHFGKFVVVSENFDLPDRCVHCNGETYYQIIQNIGPWRRPLHIGLCRSHARVWRIWHAIGVGSFILGTISLIIFGAAIEESTTQSRLRTSNGVVEIIALAALVTGLLYLPAFIIDRFLKPMGHMKRKGETIWLWRSSLAFRRSLHPLNQSGESTSTRPRT